MGAKGSMAAVDVVLRHAAQIMLAHAQEVAELRNEVRERAAALEDAYAALDAVGQGDKRCLRVPGFAEWLAAKQAAKREVAA